MPFLTGELLSTGFTILATSLALAAVSEIATLRATNRVLENSISTLTVRVTTLEQSQVRFDPNPVGQLPKNTTQNVFYAGTATQVKLDEPILGPPAPGELDGYDTVYPSVLAYGTAVVRGTGRLILDGDASDIVLKIDNTYFSLRELFGFGSTLSYETAPPPAAPPDAQRVLELCTDPDLLSYAERPGDRSNCIYRRNWGVDACFTPDDNTPERPPEAICICGGGWQPLSRVVRVRHFVRKIGDGQAVNASELQALFFQYAPQCCSPMVATAGAPCNLTNYAWLDTMLRCENTEDRLCSATDRADYLGLYAEIVNTPGNETEELLNARNIMNARGWSATRDFRFDNGEWYALQLSENVERACQGLRLSFAHTHEFTNAFPAAFECGTGARIWFEVAPSADAVSYRRGSEYYALTHEPSHRGWFCLSREIPSANRTQYIGDAAQFYTDQLAWLPFPEAEGLCQKLYLGYREVYGFARGEVMLGIYLDKENNLARFKNNVEFAILPHE